MIELKGVSFNYKGISFSRRNHKKVLSDINISIEGGKNIGIIGSNGSGKTTLLKIIAGILKPDEGQVVMQKKLRSVFIGLQPGFMTYLSGLENVKLVCLLLGMSNIDIKKKLDEIIRYSELEESIFEPVYTYSAGMRARLAFSIAIHSNPDLILIDEAMGVGDRQFKVKSSVSLNAIIAGRASSVIVSHDENYLKEVCQEILHFKDGSIEREVI